MHNYNCPKCQSAMQCVIGGFYICPHCENNKAKTNSSAAMSEAMSVANEQLMLIFSTKNSGRGFTIDFPGQTGNYGGENYRWDLTGKQAISLLGKIKAKESYKFLSVRVDYEDGYVAFYSSKNKNKGRFSHKDILKAAKAGWSSIF